VLVSGGNLDAFSRLLCSATFFRGRLHAILFPRVSFVRFHVEMSPSFNFWVTNDVVLFAVYGHPGEKRYPPLRSCGWRG
jgi:hypothetical protein